MNKSKFCPHWHTIISRVNLNWRLTLNTRWFLEHYIETTYNYRYINSNYPPIKMICSSCLYCSYFVACNTASKTPLCKKKQANMVCLLSARWRWMRLKLAGERGFSPSLLIPAVSKFYSFNTSYMGVCLFFIIRMLLMQIGFKADSDPDPAFYLQTRITFLKENKSLLFVKKYVLK